MVQILLRGLLESNSSRGEEEVGDRERADDGWNRLSREGDARLEAEEARPVPRRGVRMSGSLGGDRGQPVPGKDARTPGLGGRLKLGAQALHCTRFGRTEATPRCALLWSAGNAAKAKGDRKWQVRGPGTFWDMPLPRLCRLPLFTPCASLTSVQPKALSEGAYPGPGSCLPAFPAQPWFSPGPEQLTRSGGASGWECEGGGQGGPVHLGGEILIRLRPSLSWSGSHLVSP